MHLAITIISDKSADEFGAHAGITDYLKSRVSSFRNQRGLVFQVPPRDDEFDPNDCDLHFCTGAQHTRYIVYTFARLLSCL